jgi:hypothetical protein
MPSSASTNQPLTSTPTTTVTEELQESPATPNPISEQVLPQSSSSVTNVISPIPTEDQPNQRPVQHNKARCFMCRAKIPLAKQTINRCRCGEYYLLIMKKFLKFNILSIIKLSIRLFFDLF